LEKARDERNLVERIMNCIPGYKGYKEKELRRESDRLVRMEVVSRLRDAKTALRRSFTNPAMFQRMSEEDRYRYDTLLSRLDRVTQRIDKAVAGYAGIFDAIKVREDKLDQVICHDVSLIEKAESVRVDVRSVIETDVGGEAWRQAWIV